MSVAVTGTGLIRAGVVSVSFRHSSITDIIRAACDAGLEGIEWGGDVHVPHGDESAALRTAALCREAGIAVAAYGSYLRFSAGDPDPIAVLDSAQALGAPLIRVWAGIRSSAETDVKGRESIVEALISFTAAAALRRLRVALEYHGGTLTDNADSALALLRAVPGLESLWQPPNGQTAVERAAGLQTLLPHLANLHVFNWGHGSDDRRPLAGAAVKWTDYLRIARDAAGDRWALLEFMPDNELSSLDAEAATLRNCLEASGG